MQLRNYISSQSRWAWTGVRTYNQLWSYFRVDEPTVVTSIDVYWGGYGRSTKGRHFIARVNNSNRAERLGAIVVRSSMIDVPQGRGWRRAKVQETLLEPGNYAVGIWGDYLSRRTVGEWVDNQGLVLHAKTNTSLQGNTTGTRWRANGVLPCRLNGEPAGRVNIKASGNWRKGQAYVKVGGSWRKAKGVWVRSNGAWRRGQ